MKIKECICRSTEPVKGIGTISICLAYFIRDMAAILVLDSEQRLSADYPSVTFGNDKEWSGKAKKDVTVKDVIDIFVGNDLARETAQFVQLQGFMKWFLEQNEPDTDEDSEFWSWDNIGFVSEKWNEYARMKAQESEKADEKQK